MITRELLDEFKLIYKEEFKSELNDEEATKMATDLLNVMRILTRPIPKTEPDTETPGYQATNQSCQQDLFKETKTNETG